MQFFPAKKDLWLLAALAAVYFVAAKWGLTLAFDHPSATPIWPPTGIALAAMLLLGYRIWPAIFLGAFLANVTTEGTVLTSLGIALGNTLEGVVGAYLVNRFAGGRNAFERAPDIFRFALLAGAVSTAVSATVGVGSLTLAGFANPADYWSVWFTWWLGDLGGNFIVAPLILLWATTPRGYWGPEKIVEAVALLVTVFIFGNLIFDGLYSYVFLFIPLLIWAAFRFSKREAATVMVLVSAIAIWGTLNGAGPFAREAETLNESLLLLQAFLVTVAFSTMILAALVSELWRKERLFRALIEESSDAVSLIDKWGNVLYASPSTERVLGYTAEEFVGRNGFLVVHPDDLERSREILVELVKKPGEVVRNENQVQKKDGTWIWIESTSTNLLDDPAIEAIVVNYRDITERKERG